MPKIDDRDIRIAQLEWVVIALVLKHMGAESEATVILPARSLGIYAGFDLTITEGENYASVVHVKVLR